MNMRRPWFLIALLLMPAGCNSGHGTDSLLSRQPHTRAPISECVRCHSSSNSAAVDPLVTNGTGTYGKHVKHFSERQIPCERCHAGYMSSATHMNGSFDVADPLVSLVSLSITGPTGAWVNDTGPGTGSCAGVACHGNNTLDWYGTATWTTPVCTTCHSSSFSAALDPTATNGTPPEGRHEKHASSRAIGCERCHYQYPTRTTHANGTLDTADPTRNIVIFNIVATTGTWTNDTGSRTGQCATISCHGTDMLDWYGTGAWSLPANCTTCHASTYSTALDPLLTNGTGASGKHSKHVGTIGFACTKCHLDYPSHTSHASGVLDTPDPGVLLVYFDGTNTSGTWTGDTGQETGGCATTNCHTGQSPEWYGTAGVTTPACVICHVNAMGNRRPVVGANGDFGANAAVKSHHVTRGPGNDPLSDQCRVCHDMSTHMGGTVRLRSADTGTAIAYDLAAASTLEPFCLSCHDASGASLTYISGGTPTSPFNDGSVIGQIPYRASAEISTHWNKTYGHKQKGQTCVGNGSMNTGCHGNGHGTANVGLLARNLTLPYPLSSAPYEAADANDYDLCFTCHESAANATGNQRITKEGILGVKAGSKYDWDHQWGGTTVPPYYVSNTLTHFKDRYDGSGKSYDDSGSVYSPGQYANLHFYHLQDENWWFYWGIGSQGGWNYRNNTASAVHCLTCHNVHGSNTQWGWVYDELLYTNSTTTDGDSYGSIGLADPHDLSSYPVNCLYNCHYNMSWPTHNWFDPAGD